MLRFNAMTYTVVCSWRGCGKAFEPTREGHKFCSNKCRMDFAGSQRKEAMKLLAAARAAPTALEVAAEERPNLDAILNLEMRRDEAIALGMMASVSTGAST